MFHAVMRKLFLLSLLLATQASFADDSPKLPRMVRNPAAEFLSSQPYGPVLAIHYDFDGDGIEDVAYADRTNCGHHGNCVYQIFLRRAADRYIEVGNIMFWEHLRLRPHRGKRGGVVQAFTPETMLTYLVNGHGIRLLSIKANPLHYDPTTGEVPASDHARELVDTTYTLEEFAALASKPPDGLTTRSGR